MALCQPVGLRHQVLPQLTNADEEPLQKAILAAINSVMSQKSTLIRQITSAMEMELAPVPGESMSLADIERRLGELNDQTRELVAESARSEDATACTAQLRAIMNEAAALKEKRAFIEDSARATHRSCGALRMPLLRWPRRPPHQRMG